MTYLKRTNPLEKKGKRITGTIIFLIAVIFCLNYFFPNLFASIISPAAVVMWNTEQASTSGFGKMLSLVRSKYNILLENESLRREVASRDSGMLMLEMLKTENDNLKEALGRSSGGKDVLGVVLSRPPISSYDSLIVDVGSNNGVAQGDKVYVNGSVLVGDVDQVFAESSRISLFSTPGRVVPVLVGSSTVEVRAVGRGGGNFEARLPAAVEMQVGDIVTLSQLRSHVFGLVERVTLDSTDSIQTLLFKAPVNMHEIRYVEVETR